MPMTIRALAAAALCMLAAPAFADSTVTLRARVEAHGPAVTLGDLFEGAGAAAGRAVAPAPDPGQISTLGAPFLAAAAQSAGLAWTPPAGLTQVRVVRPAGARATIAPDTPANANGEVVIRRGDVIQLVYVAPGLQLTTRARTLGNAAIGDSVRLVNLQSNRTVEAIVTGPGAAAASAP